MARSSKDVSQVIIVGSLQVFPLRHSVVVSAVHALGARAPGEVDAEVRGMALLEVVSLGVACVDLRPQFGQGWCSVDVDVAICKVLVVPYVVVVVALLVSSILLRLVDLASSWSLHPLVHLEVLELVQLSDLLL